jgi:TrpR-related protein YerC/YecD
MKLRRDPSKGSQSAIALYRAILTLKTEAEVAAFLNDLCTPAELQAIADRWGVVALLEQGVSYRDIHAQTGVSVTTIGRVARFLHAGNGGYGIVQDRLKERARG